MSQLVYKRFRRKDGGWRHVPYEIFTQEEAAERGIEPLSRIDWRERFFDNHENLTGQYILTDDAPPLVAPVLKCYISNPPRLDKPGRPGRGGDIKKLHLPWTHVMGRGHPVLFGVKVGVVCQHLKSRYGRVTTNQRKLFILLVALGCGHNKAVLAIWGLEQKVDQNYLRKLIMGDEKTEQAMSELARDVFKRVGFGPDEVVRAMKDLVFDKDTPASVKAKVLEIAVDRMALDDREEKVQQTTVYAGMGVVEGGKVHPRVTAGLAREIVVKAGGGDKVAALIESQGEVVPDE